MPSSCPNCGRTNDPSSQFCTGCGQRRSEAAKASLQIGDGERRRLTVMFCDLVGSTPLAERLDPEELRDVYRLFQQACADEIERAGGHIARYMGDGLLAYFGYPRAQEDDARQSVRAGLAIIEQVLGMARELKSERGIELAARVGLHTGLVVVGEMGAGARRELDDVTGETPNVASRLQSMAAPNSVLISSATQALVSGYFQLESLGEKPIRGLSRPIAVYQVLNERQVGGRLEAQTSSELAPFIGRRREVSSMIDAWRAALAGSGQVVLISGEPGIGKSRLCKAFKDAIADDNHELLEVRGSAYHQNSAFYPVIDMLTRSFGIREDDSNEVKLARIDDEIAQFEGPREESAALVRSLLSLAAEGQPAAFTMSDRQRRQLLNMLVSWALQSARRAPVLLMVDDLHWVDPSTMALLGQLVERSASERLMMVATFRPEIEPPWAGERVTYMPIARLGAQEVQDMAAGVAGGRMLPPELLAQIAQRTDGVPLFVEELTRGLLESRLLQGQVAPNSSGPLGTAVIPATLHDSLMSRLDRLNGAKRVAQLGATLGREFSYSLIQALSGLDEPALRSSLARLQEADILRVTGTPPDATYVFRHALIRDAAYESLLRSNRQQIHRQVAQILTQQFKEVAETQPELIAQHYSAGGMLEEAIAAWQAAGVRSSERSAYEEAIVQYRTALELLELLPESVEREQREMQLQVALAAPLLAARGYGSSDLEAAYDRAEALSQKLGESPLTFTVLRGQLYLYLAHADYERAWQRAQDLVAIAERVKHPALAMGAELAQAMTLYFLGEHQRVREHVDSALEIYDPAQHRSRGVRAGQDPGVSALALSALNLWMVGLPDQARDQLRRTLELADQIDHPLSTLFALYYACLLHQMRREPADVERCVEIADTHGFTPGNHFQPMYRGWVLAHQGRTAEGIAMLRDGIARWRGSGSEVNVPQLLALLAEAYVLDGQGAAGLAVTDEALALAERTGQRYWNAELQRLRGDLLRLDGAPPEEVRASYLNAVEAASGFQQPLLAIRAQVSLYHSLEQRTERVECAEKIARDYERLSEGFASRDLADARLVLAEAELPVASGDPGG
jgi:class 3 adenylate cyclase/predicted ATPase